MSRKTEAAFDWGVPDWRDAGSYGDTRSWGSSRWRWEFTRRRDDYRRDFCEALDALTREEFVYINLLPENDPPLRRQPGARLLPFPHPNARKYGLDEFFDPVVGEWHGIGSLPDFEWTTGPLLGIGRPPGPTDDETNWVSSPLVELTFDMLQPLGPQLDAAQRYLSHQRVHYVTRQTKEGRASRPMRAAKHHTGNWLRYLRVLDARAAGASLSEISRVILEGTNTRADPRTAGNVLAQAKALMFRF